MTHKRLLCFQNFRFSHTKCQKYLHNRPLMLSDCYTLINADVIIKFFVGYNRDHDFTSFVSRDDEANRPLISVRIARQLARSYTCART